MTKKAFRFCRIVNDQENDSQNKKALAMRETRTAQSSVFDFYSQHEFGVFLRKLSDVLDAHPEILSILSTDLLRDGIESTGRKGLSVESIFRCMLLKQMTGVSYEMLAFYLTDSQSYRSFARLDRDCRPGRSALSHNIRRIKPQTLEAIFEHIGLNAFNRGIVDITRIRVDSSVVKSNIAPPSDSQLLNDGIRVLSRLMAKSKEQTGIRLRLTDYRKVSRSLSARIFYGKKHEKDQLYPELIELSKRVVRQSEKATDQVQDQCSDRQRAQRWLDEVKHYRQLLVRVIDQAERRVIQGEAVPASEKLVSLFEPHTDIIIKGHRDIDYGHKINLATDKSGWITALMIEQGNPCDTERFIPLMETHERQYGCVPNTTIADGGYASQANIAHGKALGIKRVGFHKKNGISLSKMGLKEKTLKKLRDFRAGIEGNISELKRGFGAAKALWKGEEGFMAFVWSSVISYNLTRLVRLDSG
jgi:IS5 family transposase